MFKIHLKKLVFMLLAGASFSAYTQVYNPNTYTNCCGRKGYIGVEGDYFRFTSDNFHVSEDVLSLETPVGHSFSHDPKYRWGGKVIAGFYLCDRNYIGADYSFYKSHWHTNLPLINDIDTSASGEFRYNEGNLVLGHNFGTCTWNLNLYGGLQAARLRINRNFPNFVSDGEDDMFTQFAADRHTTSGIGPNFGFEAAYNVSQSFQIVGGGSDALLYSREKFDHALNGISQPFDRRRVIINNLYTKLGLAYVTTFNCDCTKLRIEGGWKMHSFYAPDGGEGSSGPYLAVTVGF